MAGITMTGMSGIDVGSLISQLVALKQQEVTRVTDRKTVANKQVDAYTKLSSYLNEFSSKAIKRENDKPSVIDTMRDFREKMINVVRDRVKVKHKEGPEL